MRRIRSSFVLALAGRGGSCADLLHEQVLDFGLVGRRNDPRIAEVALLFRRLFGQDVTVISVFALDLPVPVKEKRFFAAALVFILGMSVIVSLVIHSPQRYESFYFCHSAGAKSYLYGVMGKIGIHKKRRAERTNIPGICGGAGEGHRIYAGPCRVPPGRYSFPVLSAGEPCAGDGYSGRYFRMPGW